MLQQYRYTHIYNIDEHKQHDITSATGFLLCHLGMNSTLRCCNSYTHHKYITEFSLEIIPFNISAMGENENDFRGIINY